MNYTKVKTHIAYIFDCFRECEVGNSLLVPGLQDGMVDNNFDRYERNELLVMFRVLVFNGYFTIDSESNQWVTFTQKGFDYFQKGERLDLIVSFDELFQLGTLSKEQLFRELWALIGYYDSENTDNNAMFYISGPIYYKTIKNYLLIPDSYNSYIEKCKKNGKSTSRRDWYPLLFLELLDSDVNLFLKDLSKAFNRTIDLDKINNSQNSSCSYDFLPFDVDNGINVSHSIGNTEVNVGNVISLSEKSVVDKAPIVFISYSWDGKEHEEWVLDLATKLRNKGVDVILDKWDLGPLGSPLPHFMEQSIVKSNRVVCILTPNYKKKTDDRSGGVGYEFSIISSNIFKDNKNRTKFIPLLRSGSIENTVPGALDGGYHIDMRDNSFFDENFKRLLRDIFCEPEFKKPPLGKRPMFE